MKKLIILLIVVVIAGVFLAGPISNLIQDVKFWNNYIPNWDNYQDSANTALQKKQLLAEHNKIRQQKGLKSVTVENRLNTAAQKHADYMAKRGKLSHYGTKWSRPSTRIVIEGYDYISVAENIATGQNTVEEVVQAWMDSSGHQENIIGNYDEIGFGISYGDDNRIYWCVVFARPQH